MLLNFTAVMLFAPLRRSAASEEDNLEEGD